MQVIPKMYKCYPLYTNGQILEILSEEKAKETPVAGFFNTMLEEVADAWGGNVTEFEEAMQAEPDFIDGDANDAVEEYYPDWYEYYFHVRQDTE